MRYQRELWSLDMPKGWTYEETGLSVAFYNPGGIGTLNVSVYRKDELVTDSDLRELADCVRLSPVGACDASGFTCNVIQGNRFWIKWWLRSGNVMVFVTYNCDIQDQGTEENEIDHLISSIEII